MGPITDISNFDPANKSIAEQKEKLHAAIMREYDKAMLETGLSKKKLKNPMKTLARKLMPQSMKFSNRVKNALKQAQK